MYDVIESATPTPVALKEAVESFSGELIIDRQTPQATQPAAKAKTKSTKADLPSGTGAGSW